MTKQTHIETFVHARQAFDGDPYVFTAHGCDMSDFGYIPICKVEIPAPDITQVQLKARHLVLLRLERDKVYEKARAEAELLDERIAKLEAIGYSGPAEEPLA